MKSHLAISGLGGSGTRVFANLISHLGYFIGEDMNGSSDNLWWTLLFKRRSVLFESRDKLEALYNAFANRMGDGSFVARGEIETRINQLAGKDRIQHDVDWLQARLATFREEPRHHNAQSHYWAWKEPNTHILADFLLDYDRDLTLIHVVRDPIYMSFSANQNQLALWGPVLLDQEPEIDPLHSLAYWCQTHARLEEVARKFEGRLIFVSHEYACLNPEAAVDSLAAIVQIELSTALRQSASKLISSEQVGRPSAKIKSYSFADEERKWAEDFMKRQFGDPVSRLCGTYS